MIPPQAVVFLLYLYGFYISFTDSGIDVIICQTKPDLMRKK